MSQRIMITNAIIENNELLFSTDSQIEIADISATGQMLVDSDQLSFNIINELAHDSQPGNILHLSFKLI